MIEETLQRKYPLREVFSAPRYTVMIFRPGKLSTGRPMLAESGVSEALAHDLGEVWRLAARGNKKPCHREGTGRKGEGRGLPGGYFSDSM